MKYLIPIDERNSFLKFLRATEISIKEHLITDDNPEGSVSLGEDAGGLRKEFYTDMVNGLKHIITIKENEILSIDKESVKEIFGIDKLGKLKKEQLGIFGKFVISLLIGFINIGGNPGTIIPMKYIYNYFVSTGKKINIESKIDLLLQDYKYESTKSTEPNNEDKYKEKMKEEIDFFTPIKKTSEYNDIFSSERRNTNNEGPSRNNSRNNNSKLEIILTHFKDTFGNGTIKDFSSLSNFILKNHMFDLLHTKINDNDDYKSYIDKIIKIRKSNFWDQDPEYEIRGLETYMQYVIDTMISQSVFNDVFGSSLEEVRVNQNIRKCDPIKKMIMHFIYYVRYFVL